MRKFVFLFLICFMLLGCSDKEENYNADGTISYMYAKELIINNGAKMIDVRTSDEYNEDHIEGAMLLPVDDISEEKALNVIGSKDTYVIVYCKSGARSKSAADKLISLGYKNVYNLGSINNWKE